MVYKNIVQHYVYLGHKDDFDKHHMSPEGP